MRDRRVRLAVHAALFVVSVTTAAAVIRPWIAAPLAFDAAASVLHFDRIVTGDQLELPLSTTPKPLLTLLYGLIYSLTGDWRAISLATLVVWGLSVASAAVLTWRLGGLVAAVFAAVSLVLSARLLLEVAWGLASVWALLLWIVAGLAVTSSRPRWGIAGALLGLAALARLETFLVLGLALAVLAVMRFGPRPWRRPVPPRAWRISIGLVALPIMCLHDLFLTGDPLFWTSVAATYSAAAELSGRLPSLADVARLLGELVSSQPAVTILALVGGAVMAIRAQWAILVGLIALGPGVALFLLTLAARHTFVDQRYLVPITVAMIVAAAVGLSVLRVPDLAPLASTLVRDPAVGGAPDRSLRRIGVLGLAAAAIALVCAPTIGPLDLTAQSTITSARHAARSADLSLADMRLALADSPASGSDEEPAAGAARFQLVVPVSVRPRVAVDLDRSLLEVGSYRDLHAWAADGPPAGQLILIDVGTPSPSEATSEFLLSAPGTAAGVRLVPLISDPTSGTWLLQVSAQ